LHTFIYDAKRFALYNRSVIEQVPLQLYCSAPVFSPEKSIVRRTFENYIPPWIQRKPRVQAHWSAALQTLEGHTSSVTSVAFSPDGNPLPTLRISDYWVVEGEANILWLPPDYRSTCAAIWDQTVVLGHSLGRLSFLQFRQGL
jgi:WD40 repeat protein